MNAAQDRSSVRKEFLVNTSPQEFACHFQLWVYRPLS